MTQNVRFRRRFVVANIYELRTSKVCVWSSLFEHLWLYLREKKDTNLSLADRNSLTNLTVWDYQ